MGTEASICGMDVFTFRNEAFTSCIEAFICGIEDFSSHMVIKCFLLFIISIIGDQTHKIPVANFELATANYRQV